MMFKRLSAKEQDEVRRRYATGTVTYRELGKRFGVSRTTIYYVVRGRKDA